MIVLHDEVAQTTNQRHAVSKPEKAVELEGFFWNYDPKWLLMIQAYLDESFDNPRNRYVTIGGHCGNEEAWTNFIPAWNTQLGNQRKRLHMKSLRWHSSNTERLLSRLGPVPIASGLQRVVTGVNVSDYEDILQDSKLDKMWLNGYMIALNAAVTALLFHLPQTETLELALEMQEEYEEAALMTVKWITENQRLKTPDGKSRLAKCSFIPKGECMLFDQADYTAYAILQQCRDENSLKSKWCSPILKGGTEIGQVVGRVSRCV